MKVIVIRVEVNGMQIHNGNGLALAKWLANLHSQAVVYGYLATGMRLCHQWISCIVLSCII